MTGCGFGVTERTPAFRTAALQQVGLNIDGRTIALIDHFAHIGMPRQGQPIRLYVKQRLVELRTMFQAEIGQENAAAATAREAQEDIFLRIMMALPAPA